MSAPTTPAAPSGALPPVRVEQRALHGAFAGTVGFAFTLVQAIASVPLLLHFWSEEQYGIWLALQAAYTLLITVDTGHQNYIGNELLRLHVEDRARMRQVLASSLLIACALAGISVLVTLGLIVAGQVGTVAGAAPDSRYLSQLDGALLALVIAWALTGSYGGILVRLYIPVGDFARSAWLGLAQRILLFAALVGAVAFGGGLLAAAVASSVMSGAFAVYLFRDLRRRIPDCYPWWQGASWSVGWQTFRKAVGMTGIGFVTGATVNLLLVAVARTLGSAAVPVLTTLRTVTNTGVQISTVLLNPLVPDLVRYVVAGEWRKLRESCRLSWIVVSGMVNLGVLLTLPLVPWLYGLWTHGKLEFLSEAYLLLVLGLCVRTAAAPFQLVVASLNRLPVAAASAAASLLCTVGLGTLLAPSLGLVGFALALLAAEVSVALLSYADARRVAPAGPAGWDVRSLLPVLLPLLAVAAGGVGSLLEPALGWLLGPGLAVLLGGYYLLLLRRLDDETKARLVRLVPAPLRRPGLLRMALGRPATLPA